MKGDFTQDELEESCRKVREALPSLQFAAPYIIGDAVRVLEAAEDHRVWMEITDTRRD